MTVAQPGPIRAFDTSGWTTAALLESKGTTRVTLCFPCRDEVATIGGLVTVARRQLLDTGVVDDVLVLDDRSVDGTGIAAEKAGARVVHIDEIHAQHGSGSGKGNALWGSLIASEGDVVVWCDGDLTSFTASWVERLLAPLLTDANVALVKATYVRPTHLGGGGRTTELVARPLLSLFAPHLAGLGQPLAGEFAGRRDVLERVPFVEGWGVEIALLLDIAALCGVESIVEVDLGVRHHRHRTLESLSVQAAEVMATFLSRVGRGCALETTNLFHADGSVIPLNIAERPPLRER